MKQIIHRKPELRSSKSQSHTASWKFCYSFTKNNRIGRLCSGLELLTKKYSHNLKVESCFIWWECLGQEAASQELWENCSKETGGRVRLYTSLQQREQAVWASEIRKGAKEFSILCMRRCKPLGSLNPFLSYAPQLSGTNPVSLLTLLLAFPQLLSNHHQGWQPLLDYSLGSSHSHLEARNRWWQRHFLFIDMAGDNCRTKVLKLSHFPNMQLLEGRVLMEKAKPSLHISSESLVMSDDT